MHRKPRKSKLKQTGRKICDTCIHLADLYDLNYPDVKHICLEHQIVITDIEQTCKEWENDDIQEEE